MDKDQLKHELETLRGEEIEIRKAISLNVAFGKRLEHDADIVRLEIENIERRIGFIDDDDELFNTGDGND